MTTPKLITDALGNEIVMGKSYGYTISSSGVTTVVIGVADSVTKTGKVSLVITKATRYLYGEDPTPYSYDASKVAVYGCNLFPV